MTVVARDQSTVVAFLGIALFGGVNAIAVRFSNQELAPFWGAAFRFAIASGLLFGVVAIRRVPLPRGAALTGALLYGLFGFAAAFAFLYWGLVDTPAGVTAVVLALVPLLTFLLAVGQGQERFRLQSLVGAGISVLGVGLVFGERVGSAIPIVSLLAILAGAASMAESNVVVKRFPKCHPTANNAIAMGVGAVVLLLAALVAGERLALPTEARTWAAVGYLSLVGSIVVFSLFLYVISRWSASATSYALLLMPLVTIALAAVLANEAVTSSFLLGGVLVLVGVYVGAFAPPLKRFGAARPAALETPVGTSAGTPVRGQALAGEPWTVTSPTHPGCA
jgi:drug/metabolite transporter (DMT)-like permease